MMLPVDEAADDADALPVIARRCLQPFAYIIGGDAIK